MVNIEKISQEGLNRYFNTLKVFGYKSYGQVDKLLILLLIEELLNSTYKFFITEEHYKIIDKALYCLFGTTCLIPYPEFINEDTIFLDTYYINKLRFMEDNSIRLMEDNTFRIMEN